MAADALQTSFVETPSITMRYDPERQPPDATGPFEWGSYLAALRGDPKLVGEGRTEPLALADLAEILRAHAAERTCGPGLAAIDQALVAARTMSINQLEHWLAERAEDAVLHEAPESAVAGAGADASSGVPPDLPWLPPMAQSSFLRRVTKYPRRPGFNARENRLTEITAGVLEHVRGFAEHLVAAMLESAATDLGAVAKAAQGSDAARRADDLERRCRIVRSNDWAPQIRTQVSTASGGYVDLEVRLRDMLRPELDQLLWIEVKHGAPLHGDQLAVYERDIPCGGIVLVVAPLQSMPDHVPPHIPVIPWQRLADVVQARCLAETSGSSERFILTAYADYLVEENLMGHALTPIHALAVEHGPDAEAVLASLCEAANAEVQRRWADCDDQYVSLEKPKYGPGWWAAYPLTRRAAVTPAPTTWRSSFMDWGFQFDDGREDARNQLAFVAGVSMDKSDVPAVVEQNVEWLSSLRAGGFHDSQRAGYHRVRAFVYPEQLLSETTLEGQARALADWVIERFELLISMPPLH